MIRRPPRSTLSSSSAASDVYKRQPLRPGDATVSRLLPGEHASVRIPYDVVYGVHEPLGTLVTVHLTFIDAFGRDWTKQVPKHTWERTRLTAGVIYGNDNGTRSLIPVPLNREGYTRPVKPRYHSWP